MPMFYKGGGENVQKYIIVVYGCAQCYILLVQNAVTICGQNNGVRLERVQ